MTKRIISFMTVLAALCTLAQNAVGGWRIHTSFVGNDVKAVAEGNRWVYYQSGGNLFRLDKDTQENESLNIINDLSDMDISQTYYNHDRDYMVVIYKNANIDIILSDGTVVNMPEIKDAVMTQSKSINDVTFADGRIYLATGFGYVVIDDNKFVIKESHIFGTPLSTVAQVGNWLLLSYGANLYYGDAAKYHEQLAAFQTAVFEEEDEEESGIHFSREATYVRPISDSTFFCLTDSTFVVTFRPDSVQGIVFSDSLIIEDHTTQLQATKGGYLLNVPSKKQCYKTNEEGMDTTSFDTEGELCSANPRGDGTIWAAGEHGLHPLNTAIYFRPNALSFSAPFWMTYNSGKNMLYVSSASANWFVSGTAPTYINSYDGILWKDVTPEDAPAKGSYWFEFVPGDDDTYLMGTWNEGLLRVTNDKIVMKYDTTNSPIMSRGKGEWVVMHPIASIDRNGNLWVVQTYENSEHPIMALPAAQVRMGQSSKEDWIQLSIDEIHSGYHQRARFICTKHGNQDIKVFSDGNFERPLFLWKTDNVLTVNPEHEKFSSLTDQDSEMFSWTNIMCLTEDNNGYVWMGTSEGICYFNPSQAFTAGNSFHVIRPKVPRNDGTGYADRLMDGIQVNDIAVDGANRKWIATHSSGLFLVSADGSQIINKFNTTNSPLASNTIYRVCCNPNSNSVYVTTPNGVYEYFSDSSPAEINYNNIYAYPNPVRPEYGGDVTITGMMEGTLIKIADASGNVVRQLKSTGGMATWDLCDEGGERVKTGVYLVLCSQANSSSNSAVIKIAVIR